MGQVGLLRQGGGRSAMTVQTPELPPGASYEPSPAALYTLHGNKNVY